MSGSKGVRVNGFNFSERVRAVLAGARDEAERMHHEYVGTEHILLALSRLEEGGAASIFQNLETDRDAIRQLITQTVHVGREGARSGPDLPYTSRAKKVLELSMGEARDLGHDYVGTEHLLLGLIREEKGIAAQVLAHHGLTVERARNEMLKLVGWGRDRPGFGRMFPPGLDALEAAPEFHTLILENDHVRVLETRIPPGKTTPVHTHRYPAVHHFKSWSHFVRRNEMNEVLLDTRETEFSRSEPGVVWGNALPPHSVENVGTENIHVISVEIKTAWTGV